MKKALRYSLILFCCLMAAVPSTVVAKTKNAYEIILKIEGGKDTMMMMGNYYARGNQVVDTAYRDDKGRFVFSGTDTLAWGLYFFANEKGEYVEFVVYKEKPFFTFETKEGDWTSNMKVKGSRENDFFFDFHRVDGQLSKTLMEKERTLDSAAFAAFKRNELVRLDSVKTALIEQHPEKMLSKMMLATKENYTPVVDEKEAKIGRASCRERV